MIDVQEVARYIVALAAGHKLRAQWSLATWSPTHDAHRFVHFRLKYAGDETLPERRVEATRAALAAIESTLAPLKDCLELKPAASPTHREAGEPRPDIRSWFVVVVCFRGSFLPYAQAAWDKRPPLPATAG
ncbi:hypothetical protein [Nannocystis radixulma]|uniref:Uncharacterized protein n=1 Tax=Nannocystis radixulma TaxID=2995305 RepID=A0ABT5B9S8_9BACT|nr:hypothetical protein [Nannocystis radixulma]MDC0670178.1 hypothetical protein [Nannocystis radixulma]